MPDEKPNPKPAGGRGEGPPPVKFNRTALTWVAFVGLALVLTMAVFHNMRRSEEITADQFWIHIQNGEVEKVTLATAEKVIRGKFKQGVKGRHADAPTRFELEYDFDSDDQIIARLREAGVEFDFDAGGGFWSLVPSVLVYGGLAVLLYFLVIRQLRNVGGGAGFLGNFGRSRHRVSTKEHTNVTFEDVAGIEEAKEEVAEIIEFLRNPKRFQRLGARIPRGVLLVGEPGCGKTLLAKAIAGEAEVPFYSISGSDFVEMFVGVGASRVRDLFKQAKDNSPCIIFLDEIDAVGRRRGAGFTGGGHDEREQTLNAILVEMDGFDTNDQIIVIAATNRMDVLDPALTRPGRFDRQIEVPLPDIKGRFEILKIYADRVRSSTDVDLQRLARGTPMFSGADLAALVNEAAIAATMAGKDCIDQGDLEEARDKVRWGRARKSRVIDEREKEMTAYHEAGHALVQILSPEADPLHKVSIIPRGVAGGATFSLPEKDRHLYTRQWCQAFIRVAMAGRIAEEVVFNDVDSGAASDIAQATSLARRMVMDWGMSDKLGFVRYAPDTTNPNVPEWASREYSEKTAEIIDQEIKVIMDAAEAQTRQLIQSNRDKLEAVARALLRYETLDVKEVERILDGRTLDRPTVGDLLEAERTKHAAPAKTADRPETGPAIGAMPQPG